VLLAEDHDDEDVGDECDRQDGGHDIPVDGNGNFRGSGKGGTVDVIAAAVVEAISKRVNL
jgi:hypothetical protein